MRDDARRDAVRVDGLARDVRQVELALLEVTAADVEVQHVERVGARAGEEAVVRLADADLLDLARARRERLLHLDDLGRLHAGVDAEVLVVELQLRARSAALQAREDRLVDVRVRAAPRDVVEVAEAKAVRVERPEGQAQAFLAVGLAVRVIEGADVRAGVVERLVQVARVRRERADVEAQNQRSLGVEAFDEARHLLVERQVREVLAAAEARVQVVEEEAVLLPVTDARVRRERERLPRLVQDVVVAERPRQAGIHEVADARRRFAARQRRHRAIGGLVRRLVGRRGGVRSLVRGLVRGLVDRHGSGLGRLRGLGRGGRRVRRLVGGSLALLRCGERREGDEEDRGGQRGDECSGSHGGQFVP